MFAADGSNAAYGFVQFTLSGLINFCYKSLREISCSPARLARRPVSQLFPQEPGTGNSVCRHFRHGGKISILSSTSMLEMHN
jgi:hypothetical protein